MQPKLKSNQTKLKVWESGDMTIKDLSLSLSRKREGEIVYQWCHSQLYNLMVLRMRSYQL